MFLQEHSLAIELKKSMSCDLVASSNAVATAKPWIVPEGWKVPIIIKTRAPEACSFSVVSYPLRSSPVVRCRLKTRLVPPLERTPTTLFALAALTALHRDGLISGSSGLLHCPMYFVHLARFPNVWTSGYLILLAALAACYVVSFISAGEAGSPVSH
jgi:hypothetical protein